LATVLAGLLGVVFFFGTGLAALTGLAVLRGAGFFGAAAFFAAGFFALALLAPAFFFTAGAGFCFFVAMSSHHCRSAVACYSLKPPLRQQLASPQPPFAAASPAFFIDQGTVTRILLALIAAYQRLLSPLLGSRCRFHPSCSEYARVSVARFGAARGGLLAASRLARCHPFSEGGYDEVPQTFTLRRARTSNEETP
jgi:uncharacterized protein